MKGKTYGWLYLGCIMAWFVSSWVPLKEFRDLNEARDDAFYAQVPPLSVPELEAGIKTFSDLAVTPGTTPNDYFTLLGRIRTFQVQCQKMARETWRDIPLRMRFNSCQMTTNGTISVALETYRTKFGDEFMMAAGQRYQLMDTPRRGDLPDGGSPLTLLFAMYLRSLPFALFAFLLRVDQVGLSLLREFLALWRPIGASLIWPVAMFKYPNDDPARQVVAGLRFAVGLLTMALSGAGAAKAGESGRSGRRDGRDQVRSAFVIPTQTPPWKLSLSMMVANRFISVTGAEPAAHLLVQPAARLTHHSGLYAEVIAPITPRGGLASDAGDVMFTSVGMNRIFGAVVVVDGSYMFFNRHPLKTTRGDLHDLVMRASFFPKARTQPYVRVDWMLPQTRQVMPGGLLYRVGSTVRLGKSLSADVSLAGHDGALGFKPERVSSVRAVLSKTMTLKKRVKLTPFIAAQHGFERSDGGKHIAVSRTWFGLTIAYAFRL